MRKALAATLAVFTFSLVIPAVGSAQSRSTTLLGQIVDAGGRGIGGRQVELVNDGVVVGTTTSSYDGRFTFAVSAGSFVVKTNVNGHVAGTRVSVTSGASAPMALIVVPSAATASPQIGAVVSTGISALASLSSVGLSVAAAEIVTNANENKDAEVLADPVKQQDAVNVIRQIIADIAGVPVSQIPQATNLAGLATVVSNLSTVAPQVANAIPTQTLASVTTVVNNIVNNKPTGSLTQ